jgi:hypothetical protein
MQKHRHKCTISKHNQVGRHGLYSGHYSGVLFVSPKNAQNAEAKCQSGAVPILLLALLALMTSAYTSLDVSQGLNPQRQLLKASVYHLATSAVVWQYSIEKGGALIMRRSAMLSDKSIIAWVAWMNGSPTIVFTVT